MDPVAFLALLRRRSGALVLCVAAGVAGALVFTAQSTELYRATTRAYVDIPSGVSTVVTANQGQQLVTDLLPSIAELASSRRVAEQVKAQLRLPDSISAIRSKLSATTKPRTLFIDISAVDPDPIRARSLADAASLAVSGVFSDLQAGRPKNTMVSLKALDGAVTPGQPFEPRPGYNLALGLALGLTSGILLALLLDALDRTVKTSVQAEDVTGAPVLGLLPRFKRGASTNITTTVPDDPAAEAYRALRTSVRFLDPDHPLQIIAVTSPSASEGKTTTAVNLAVAMAQSGERVMLVDADLRRPSVATSLGIEGVVGLSNVVTRTATLSDAVQHWGGLLDVLPAGQLPPNPSEIVGSQSMGALLEELRERYDVVVVDAPPVLAVTDAVVLATQVDGVLLVLRAGSTQRGLAVEARRRLDGVGGSVVGCVLNAVANSTAQGYYAAYRHDQHGYRSA
ncbi:MAG: polysaccharide biosynthesis tyrosine autokinase [Mycobacteriales bacterium]|nr:polysaccharide biosynthesis tyrosine autokinase [Mycobacteriales bacterium]